MDEKVIDEVSGENRSISESTTGRYFAGFGITYPAKAKGYGRLWVFDTKNEKRVLNQRLSEDQSNESWSLHWNRKNQLVDGDPNNEGSRKQIVLWSPNGVRASFR